LFNNDPYWQALDEKRVLLEARVDIQKTVLNQAAGYEDTIKTIR